MVDIFTELEDTAPRLPAGLHHTASRIARAERALFLTEGYLFAALLESDTIGAALLGIGVRPVVVLESLRRLAPRVDPANEGTLMLRVSPGYRHIEARAQGVSLVGNRVLDEIDVLVALVWDPANEVARLLRDIGLPREEVRSVAIELRPGLSEILWPPTHVVELENLGLLAKTDFIDLAPRLRSMLDPAGIAWQPIPRGDDTMEIWVERDRAPSDLRHLISDRALN